MSDASDETFDLDGKVIVVTGATRGIGKAAALELARQGAELVIVGRSTLERPDAYQPGTLEEVVEELQALGTDALGVQADLLDPEQVANVIERTLEWRGRCDVLINNSAYTSNGPILEVAPRKWQNGFQMQVTTPLQLIQGFAPGMFERGSGRVLNIGTRAARVPRQHGPLRRVQDRAGAVDRVPRLRGGRPGRVVQRVLRRTPWSPLKAGAPSWSNRVRRSPWAAQPSW